MTEAVSLTAEQVFAPENRVDPHPLYHRLRSERPLFYGELWDEWILTRYADCEAVLRDHRWSTDPHHRRTRPDLQAQDVRAEFDAMGAKVLLFLDPPDHTRLRRLVSKAFTPRSVDQLRPHVRDLVDDLLDQAVEEAGAGRTFDLMPALAYPLPVVVICELMGVPLEDRDEFQGWSSDASRLLDGDIDEDAAMRGLVAAMGLINYFNGLFEERRRHPGDDLISRLLAVEEQGDRLTEQELRSTVLLLFIAGHETTMNLIGNGMYALGRHPDELRRLQADPGLVPSAVEEMLRWDGPVHVTARIATVDLDIAGQPMPAGCQVVCLLSAANRDPARFDDPDRLDVGRADNHHLTFSAGMHFCLGAALARMESQVVFDALVRRFPDLALTAEPVEYRDHFVLRGLKALPLAF
ncbi:MAG: cytochrome P450 [Acidimicrobiales bacterium]